MQLVDYINGNMVWVLLYNNKWSKILKENAKVSGSIALASREVVTFLCLRAKGSTFHSSLFEYLYKAIIK